MKTCDDTKSLLGSWLDGELTEDQSAPLRAHLLECKACREWMQEGKVIRRWFAEANEPAEVPQGFAARVARRAFAGDPGLLVPVASERRESQLVFLLGLCAAAAGLLFFFSLMIQRESLPRNDRLEANEGWFWEREAADRAELAVPIVLDPSDEENGDDDDEDQDGPMLERE